MTENGRGDKHRFSIQDKVTNHAFTMSHPRVGDLGQSFNLRVTSVNYNGTVTECTSQVLMKRMRDNACTRLILSMTAC